MSSSPALWFLCAGGEPEVEVQAEIAPAAADASASSGATASSCEVPAHCHGCGCLWPQASPSSSAGRDAAGVGGLVHARHETSVLFSLDKLGRCAQPAVAAPPVLEPVGMSGPVVVYLLSPRPPRSLPRWAWPLLLIAGSVLGAIILVTLMRTLAGPTWLP